MTAKLASYLVRETALAHARSLNCSQGRCVYTVCQVEGKWNVYRSEVRT